ncbi:hypothetical protein [Streptomyces sp. NRRL S-474]|uniref:hypothetical protein n=1 Tax=Streptomyces sp. NRRL S-474 TaxID=1463909 RepID=UPI00131B8E80|nr:hypothetical protein [Streptomyces sp. NRRL S-474]
MDAAIAGLIGSLGGVIVGVVAQAAQSARSRRWQIADLDRVTEEQQETRLWQERRIAYAAYMDAELDATQKINWAWLTSAAGPPPEEGTDSPLRQQATEALQRASEAISQVTRHGQEVLLITSSEAVKNAVQAFSAAMAEYNPSAAHNNNPNRSEEGYALLQRLTQRHNEFVAAARDELRILSRPPTSGDTSS